MTERTVRAFERRLSYNDGNTDTIRLMHLYYALREGLKAPGGVVEVGCNQGRTTGFIGVCLEELCAGSRDFAVFDSFAGMPPLAPEDGDTFVPEGCLVATPDEVRLYLNQAGCNLEPRIVPGFFCDTLKAPQLPAKLAFAYLDGDFYESIRDSLRAVWPRMSRGGVILIDDYDFAAIPGCKRACDEFFADKIHKVQKLYGQVSGIVYV